MTTPSPVCTVNAAATPVDVTESATITIALAATAGARYWAVACSSTDELNSAAAINATLTINQTNKTATCTLSATLGSAYIFTSTVGVNGLGLDANSILQKAYTTTFKVNVLASNGARVLAEDETFEQNATAGWVAVINPALRSGTDIPVTVSGTGFIHVTSGTIDATATNVSLTTEVSGVLPVANGGTGDSTLPANDVLIGNGTSAVTGVAPGTIGNVLTNVGGVWTSAPSSSAAIAAPGATNTSNATLTAANQWILFQGNAQTLTHNSPTAGMLYRYQQVPGGADPELETTPVTLAAGTGGFTIEDPQNRFATPGSTASFATSQVIYEYMLDSTNNVFRCMRQVR